MNAPEQRSADYLGLASDDFSHYGVTGQRIEWVAWDSPAQGLVSGDIILEIRAGDQRLVAKRLPRLGYPGGGSSALWSALQLEPDASLIFKLLRRGAILEQTIAPIPSPSTPTPRSSGPCLPLQVGAHASP